MYVQIFRVPIITVRCRVSSWGTAGNTQQNRVRAQRVQGLDRQAERTTTPTLGSCVLLLAAAAATFATGTTACC